MGAHVCELPMALEGLPLCNGAFQVHHAESSAHTASTELVHCHGWGGEEEVLQREGDGTLAASHMLSMSTVQCWDQVVVVVEDNAFHVHTACTLTMEVGNPGVAANVLLAGASHGLGEVHTYADGVVLDSMTLAWVNKSMVGVQGVDKTL